MIAASASTLKSDKSTGEGASVKEKQLAIDRILKEKAMNEVILEREKNKQLNHQLDKLRETLSTVNDAFKYELRTLG